MDEQSILEDNIHFISFKRTTQYRNDYITHEMSMSVNLEVGLEKTEKYLRKRVNWLLQETMKNMDSHWDAVNTYKKEKGVKK
jgi:hypothetical protein